MNQTVSLSAMDQAGPNTHALRLVSNSTGATLRRTAPPTDGSRIARCGAMPSPSGLAAAACRDQATRRRSWPREARNRCDKSLARDIELAQHDRVAAPAREAHHRAIVCFRQRHRTAPNPIFFFLRGKRIEIENGFPLRLVGTKACKRGPAPKSARIIGVDPIIVEIRAAPRHIGDIVRPVKNCEQRVAIGRKSASPTAPASACFPPHLRQRPRALNSSSHRYGSSSSCNRRPCVNGHGNLVFRKKLHENS